MKKNDEKITIRDMFAMSIMSGLLANSALNFSVGVNQSVDNKRFSNGAYALADAMLESRKIKNS